MSATLNDWLARLERQQRRRRGIGADDEQP